MTSKAITHFLHSRSLALWCLAAAIVLLTAAHYNNLAPLILTSVYYTSVWAMAVSMAATVLTAILLHYTNKRFNILRSDTALPVSLFLSMIVAIPYLDVTMWSGTAVAPAVMACAFMLFDTFGETSPQRTVFLIMAILSLLALFTAVYLLFIPVFILGCFQMRIMTLRTLLAIILGLITPPWIALGFGILSPGDITLPHFHTAVIDLDTMPVLTLLAVTALTVIIGFGFTAANIMKVYSYNSRSRAFNGFYTLLLLATALFTIIDFYNLASYLPLLMAMTGYQASHYFVLHSNAPRGWIGIVTLMAIYWLIFIWYTWIMPLI